MSSIIVTNIIIIIIARVFTVIQWLVFLDKSDKLNTVTENGMEVTFLFQSHNQGHVFKLVEYYLAYCNAAMI